MRSLPRIGGTSSSSSRRGSKIRAQCQTTFLFLETVTKRLGKVGNAACEWHTLYVIVARRVLTNTTLHTGKGKRVLTPFVYGPEAGPLQHSCV